MRPAFKAGGSLKERGESLLGYVVGFLRSQTGAARSSVNLAQESVDHGSQGVRVT